MSSFRYVPADEAAKNHRARNPAVPPRQKPIPRHAYRNVESVLSLGDTRYITYRDSTFRIPPVPFKSGQRVLSSYVSVLAHAKQVAMTGAQVPTDAFYHEMSVLAKLLWKHVRPLGKIKRFFWRMGLMPNPFRHASEREITELTDFFLQGRMTSSVQLTKEPATR